MISQEAIKKSMVPWKPGLCFHFAGQIKERCVEEIEIAVFYSERAYPIAINAIEKMVETVQAEDK